MVSQQAAGKITKILADLDVRFSYYGENAGTATWNLPPFADPNFPSDSGKAIAVSMAFSDSLRIFHFDILSSQPRTEVLLSLLELNTRSGLAKVGISAILEKKVLSVMTELSPESITFEAVREGISSVILTTREAKTLMGI